MWPPSELESLRAELRALLDSVEEVTGRTIRDDRLRTRFGILARVWASTVEPSVRGYFQNTREFFKLAAEVERFAQLSVKFKSTSEYKKRLRFAIQLADSLLISAPKDSKVALSARHDLFIASIPDLPSALVPTPVLGWRSKMESFLRTHPWDKSVFIMIRYRPRNDALIKAIKTALSDGGLFGVLAFDHGITDDCTIRLPAYYAVHEVLLSLTGLSKRKSSIQT